MDISIHVLFVITKLGVPAFETFREIDILVWWNSKIS